MKENPYRQLSWDDLSRWSGQDILDRGKCYRNRVTDLSIGRDDRLVAAVEGRDHYLTQVWTEDGGLRHQCTCPYWGPCKHAVAVVLVYLEQVGSEKPVPEIAPEELEAALEAYGLVDRPDDVPGFRVDPARIRAALEAMPAKEIIEWATNTITGHPELWDNLPPGFRPDALVDEESENPETAKKRIARIRQEIRRVARERFAHDYWDRHYHEDGPDYSSIEAQFEDLLVAGHTGALIELGGELFTLGNEQIDESCDEGEIAFQITDCMKPVLEAIRIDGGPVPERLVRYWDMVLEDGFGLLDGIPPPVDEGELNRADWLRVGKEFMGRLDSHPDRKKKDMVDGQYRDHRRNRVLDRAVKSLVNAGDNDRAVELMVSELPHCGNHIRLVDHLLESGDHKRARYWAMEGFRRTAAQDSHAALGLAKKLQEVAIQQKDWPQAAALEAEFFFMNPGIGRYREVRKACKESGNWEKVRPFLLRYLETGYLVRSDAGWPLPGPGIGFPKPRYRRFPDRDSLISAALDEGRPDDAVDWYRKDLPGEVSVSMSLAGAVRNTHPDVTLEIWKNRIESLIGTVKPKAYREAIGPLWEVQSLLQETGRGEEYPAYVAELRERHGGKPRLMEELDFLERKHRKILDG